MHTAALTLLLGPLSAPAMAAGTALWLRGEVDPTVVSGAAPVAAGQLSPQPGWTDADTQAIDALRAELDAVRPLLDVFDGELQVIRRLDGALDAVEVLRVEDRALIYEARTFQGLAAWRYFQDTLGTDPDAAWVCTQVPDGSGAPVMANRAWVNAIAIDPDALPSPALLPDADARLAFQELRAQLMIAPSAALIAGALPDGGRLVVDGVVSGGDHARLMLGEHRVVIEGPDGARLRRRVQLVSGSETTLVTPASLAELAAFADVLDGGAAVAVPARVDAVLQTLEQPVTLVLHDGRRPLLYRVSDGAAMPLLVTGEKPRRASSDGGLSVQLGVSQAWVSDAQWLLLHAQDGAPSTKGTVNAGAPGVHAAAQWESGLFAVSAGVDARWSLGEWHYLDVGDADMRLRLHPYLGVGAPWLQATFGAALPWRLGLGARGAVPVGEIYQLTGGALWERGLIVGREGELPAYDPGDAVSAWVGVGVKLGG